MIEKKDITHLAALARLQIKEEELDGLTKDIDGILAYVGQVNTVDASATPTFIHTNIMRDDVVTSVPGEYTKDILANAPQTEDGYIKVKKILA